MTETVTGRLNRREFVQGTLSGAWLAAGSTAALAADLARSVGFTGVRGIPTWGKPGVFGRLDAGAAATVAVFDLGAKGGVELEFVSSGASFVECLYALA